MPRLSIIAVLGRITFAASRLQRQEEAVRRTPKQHLRRPELSQHFLREHAVPHILRHISWPPGALVVDIGAGDGVLTGALASRAFRVIAIEKDARLYRALAARFAAHANVDCRHADIIDARLPDGAYRVVSNVPYAITASLVRKLLAAHPPPIDAFLIVQREAAEKFAGAPLETLFSLLHKPWFDISLVGDVPRSSFVPPPRVQSSLLRIEQRLHPLVRRESATLYRDFIRTSFGRRRAVARSLRWALTDRQIRRLAADTGFSPSAHASELSFNQWLAIFRFVEHACLGRDPNGSPTVIAPLIVGSWSLRRPGAPA